MTSYDQEIRDRYVDRMVETWEGNGLLMGLEGENRRKMAVLLQNQYHFTQQGYYNHPEEKESVVYVNKELSVPLVRRIFEPFLSDIQVMHTPGDVLPNGEPFFAKARMVPASIPDLENYNCRGWGRVECETEFILDITPSISEAMSRIIHERPDSTFYFYNPFFFLSAPIIFPNNLVGQRFGLMTRGHYVKNS